MRNNVIELLARRARKLDRKRISVRQASIETGISYYTLSALVDNKLKEYPAAVLTNLCDYLECNIGDILSYEEVPPASTA